MILPFSAQINGKPTYFVEKIWEGIFKGIPIHYEGLEIGKKALPKDYIINTNKPKLHTIRDDANDRWRKDVMIDFYINCRQKNMFQFAPRLPCVSTQEVFMTYAFNGIIEISVDDTYINDRLAFAQNDGFDTWEDFFNYFYPKIKANPDLFYKGKIIHWTELRY